MCVVNHNESNTVRELSALELDQVSGGGGKGDKPEPWLPAIVWWLAKRVVTTVGPILW